MVVLTPAASVPLDRADSVGVGVGGAESNVAVGLARLGHRAVWAGRVGDDPFGRLVVAHLAAAGVDVGSVRTDPAAPTGLYAKDPRPAGTRVHYYRAGSAASRLDRTVLDDPRLAGARVLHLSGITAALSDTCRDLVEHALTRRPLAGTLISFDVNHRPGLWSADLAGPVLRRLADRADVVFVGLDEARALWGSAHPADVRRLLPAPELVVVKDGPEAATELPRHGPATVVPAPRVPVVEPVGAGDAFAAGWLSARLCGLDPVARLRWGHLLAAHALGVPGDTAPLPARDRLDTLAALPAERWARLDLPKETVDGRT
ncbi:carbohydrate kinase [Micromonospora deserti]|uniref:Carbohydrate kinase n=2 Tax=Micromonospora deserti TaxID=2070366 RepID=A0A2W2DCE0_9ACTN|nr:carbohydrate kinase [Micromonospora deserti]